ncbi:hypothetical protein [Vibrio mediterranei]|uniref:hypothetical protein n=1 Tax=Vibrio mediterranei TaxID=689 RepID=UPI004068A7FC
MLKKTIFLALTSLLIAAPAMAVTTKISITKNTNDPLQATFVNQAFSDRLIDYAPALTLSQRLSVLFNEKAPKVEVSNLRFSGLPFVEVGIADSVIVVDKRKNTLSFEISASVEVSCEPASSMSKSLRSNKTYNLRVQPSKYNPTSIELNDLIQTWANGSQLLAEQVFNDKHFNLALERCGVDTSRLEPTGYRY